jgi:hypothetical protein
MINHRALELSAVSKAQTSELDSRRCIAKEQTTMSQDHCRWVELACRMVGPLLSSVVGRMSVSSLADASSEFIEGNVSDVPVSGCRGGKLPKDISLKDSDKQGRPVRSL